MPILMQQTYVEINAVSNKIINQTIADALNDNLDVSNKIFSTETRNGQIQLIDLDPLVTNKILVLLNKKIQKSLKSEGGIVIKIPFGMIFKNSIISNLGPKIPMHTHYVGDVVSNVETKVTPYGINNALAEVFIKIKITTLVTTPFVSKNMDLYFKVPIAIKLIQGSIPNYYGGGLIKESALNVIPFE